RHLLYVACTRARDQLLVTGLEPHSEFLDDLTRCELVDDCPTQNDLISTTMSKIGEPRRPLRRALFVARSVCSGHVIQYCRCNRAGWRSTGCFNLQSRRPVQPCTVPNLRERRSVARRRDQTSTRAHRFGGDWTTAKLDVLAKYLASYTTALKDKPSKERPFRKGYIDAFAGTG
ncbi:hypothetical protein B2A_13568, partial [mine drainage metagenome]